MRIDLWDGLEREIKHKLNLSGITNDNALTVLYMLLFDSNTWPIKVIDGTTWYAGGVFVMEDSDSHRDVLEMAKVVVDEFVNAYVGESRGENAHT